MGHVHVCPTRSLPQGTMKSKGGECTMGVRIVWGVMWREGPVVGCGVTRMLGGGGMWVGALAGAHVGWGFGGPVWVGMLGSGEAGRWGGLRCEWGDVIKH